jgi:hypothetical protein
MRRRLLAGAALALLAVPATGQAQSNTGGAGYGHPLPRLVATNFSVSPRTLQAWTLQATRPGARVNALRAER